MPGINETDALEKAKTEDGTQGFSLADSAHETQDVPIEQPVAEPSITVQPIAQQPVAKEPATEEATSQVTNAPVKVANAETPLSEEELARLASEQEKTQQEVFNNLVTDYAWLREPYTETIPPEDVEKARKRGAELRDSAVRRISQAADSITTKEGVEWYAYDLADEIMMVYCPECGGDEKKLKTLTGHSKLDLARKILWGLSNIAPNTDAVIRRIKAAKTDAEQMEIYNDWRKANGFEKDENYDVYDGSDALATLRSFRRRYNGTILSISRFAEDQDQLVEAMRLSVLEGDAKEQYLFELNTADRDRAYRTYALAEAMRAYNEDCAVGVLLSNILKGFQQAPKDILRHVSPEETEEQLNWEDFAKFVNKRNGLWWGDYGKKEAWLTHEQWRMVIGEWNDEKQKQIDKAESELRSLTRDFDEHGGSPEEEFEADKLRAKIAQLANEKLIDADDAKNRYHEGWLLESKHFARQQVQQLDEDRFKPSEWGKSFLSEAGRVTGYMLPAVIAGAAVSAATGGAALPAAVLEVLLWYPSLYQEAYEYYDQMGDTTTRLEDRRNAATLAGMVNAVSQAAAIGIVVRGSSVVARGVSRALGKSAAKTATALEQHGAWTFVKDVFTLPTRQFAAKYYNGAVKTISLALVRNAARFGTDITAEGLQEASEEIVKHAAREYYGAHIKNYEGKQAVNLEDVVQATWENFKAASLDSILAIAIIRGGHAGIRRVVHRGRLPVGELGFVRVALDGTKDVRFAAALEEAKAGASEGVFKRKNFVIDFLSDDEKGREERRKSATYRHLPKEAKESLETLAKTADKIDAASRKRMSNTQKKLTPEQIEELNAKGTDVNKLTYGQWTKASLMKAIFGGESAGLEWFSPEQAEAATNLFSAQYKKLILSQQLAALDEALRADAEKLNDKSLSQKEFEKAKFSQWEHQDLRRARVKELANADEEIRTNLSALTGKDLHAFAMAGKSHVSRSQVVNTILEIKSGKVPADVKLSEGTIAFLRETFGIGDEEIKTEKQETKQTSTAEAKSEEKKESVFTTEKTAKYVPPVEPAEEPARAEPEEEKPTETPAQEEPAQEAPAQEEPARAEPEEEKPTETPAQEEPAQEAPAQEEPTQAEPAQEEPAQAEPAQEEPAREEPASTEPEEEKPTEEPTEEAPEEPKEEIPAETTEAERQKEALEKTVEDVRDLAQDNEGVLTNRQVDDVIANNDVNVASKEEQEVIRDAVKLEAFLGEHTKRIFSGMTASDEFTPKDMFGDDFLITMWDSVNAFGLLAQTEQGRAAIAGLADAVDTFVESKGQLLPEQADLVKNVHERNALKFFIGEDDSGFYRYINGLAIYNALWKKTGGDANPQFWNGTVADDLPRLALEFADNEKILELPSEMEDLVWMLNNGDDEDLAGIRDALRIEATESAFEEIVRTAWEDDHYHGERDNLLGQEKARKKEEREEKRVKRGEKKSKKEKKEEKQKEEDGEKEETFSLEAERMPRSAVETMERLRAMKPLQQDLDLAVERSAKPSAETETPTTETESSVETEQPELSLGGEPSVETEASTETSPEPKKQDTEKTGRKAFATPEEQAEAWRTALNKTGSLRNIAQTEDGSIEITKRERSYESYAFMVSDSVFLSSSYVARSGIRNRLEDLPDILSRISHRKSPATWNTPTKIKTPGGETLPSIPYWLEIMPDEVPFAIDYVEGVLGKKMLLKGTVKDLGVTFGIPAEILRDFLPGSDVATRLKQETETPVETKAETETESEKPFEVPPPKPLTDEEWNAQFERQLSTLRRVAENNEVAERIKTSDKQLKIYERAIARDTEKARKAHEAVVNPNPRARAGTKEKNAQKEADAIKTVQDDVLALEREKQWRSMLTRLQNGSHVDRIERVFREMRKEQKRNPDAKPLNIYYQWDGEVHELSASAVMKTDAANIQDKLPRTLGIVNASVRVLSNDEVRRAYIAQQNGQAARRAEWDAITDQLEASRLRDEMYRRARTEEEETEDLLNELRMRAGDWEHVTDRARDVRNPDNIQYQLGNKQAGRFKDRINNANKHGRKITPEEEKKFFDYVAKLDNPKHQCAALNWFIAGTLIPGEDAFISGDAEDTFLTACALLDRNDAWGDYKSPAWTSQWKSPLAVCHKYDPVSYGVGAPTIEEIKNLPYLSNMRVLGEGEHAVYVFDMENTHKAAKHLCEKIVQKWYHHRPWCLMQWDNKGNWNGRGYWDDYDAIDRGVAFDARGKPIAFRSSDDEEVHQWWDEHDEPHEGIYVNGLTLESFFKPEQFGLKSFDGKIVVPLYDSAFENYAETPDHSVSLLISDETGDPVDKVDLHRVVIIDRANRRKEEWFLPFDASKGEPFRLQASVPLDEEGKHHGAEERNIDLGGSNMRRTWVHGVKHGEYIVTAYDKPNGRVESIHRGQYKAGVADGTWTKEKYSESEKGFVTIERETYRKGTKDELIEYFDDGQEKSHSRFDDMGRRHGLQEKRYDNDTRSLESRIEYKHGEIVSDHTWHRDGSVRSVSDTLPDGGLQLLLFRENGTMREYQYVKPTAETGELFRFEIEFFKASGWLVQRALAQTKRSEFSEDASTVHIYYHPNGKRQSLRVWSGSGTILYEEERNKDGATTMRRSRSKAGEYAKDIAQGDDVPQRVFYDFCPHKDQIIKLFAAAKEKYKDIIQEPSEDNLMYDLGDFVPQGTVELLNGTGWDFNQFLNDIIDKKPGEGRHANGWGGYFTTLFPVAKGYAEQVGTLEHQSEEYNRILEKSSNLRFDMDRYAWMVERTVDGSEELKQVLVRSLKTGESLSDARAGLVEEMTSRLQGFQHELDEERKHSSGDKKTYFETERAYRLEIRYCENFLRKLSAIDTNRSANDYFPGFDNYFKDYRAAEKEMSDLAKRFNEIEAEWKSKPHRFIKKTRIDTSRLLDYHAELSDELWGKFRRAAMELLRATGREIPQTLLYADPADEFYFRGAPLTVMDLHIGAMREERPRFGLTPRETSFVLRQLGYLGHYYPIHYTSGNKDLSKGFNVVLYDPEHDAPIHGTVAWQILGTDKNGLPNGWFNRRTGEIVLREGCPADTIIHEVCGHAVLYWAKLNAPKLHEKLMSLADTAPQWIKDLVTNRYKLAEGSEAWREEVVAWFLAHEFSGELDSWVKTKEEKTWLKKVKELLARIWHMMMDAIGVKSSLARELSRENVSAYQAAQKIVEAFKQQRWLGTLKPRQDAAIKFMLGADKINGSLYGGARPRERENTPLAQYLNAANLFNSVLDGTKPGGAEADKKRADLKREAEATRLVDRARIRRNVLVNTKAGRDFTAKRMFAAGIPKFGSEEGGVEGWGKKVVDKLYEHVLSGALGSETPHGTFNTSAKLVAEYAKEVLLPHYMSAGEEIFTKEEADKVSPLLDRLAESNEIYEIIDLSKKIEDAFLNASGTKETLDRRRGIIRDMLSKHAEWDNSRGRKHLLTSWFQHELWRGLSMPGRTKEARAKNVEKAWNEADKILRTTTSEAHRNEALMTMRAMEFFKDGVPLKDWGMTRLSALYATIQFARTTGKDVLLAQKKINEDKIKFALRDIAAAAISASNNHDATKASHLRRPFETTFNFRESLNAVFDHADPELAKAATDAATTLAVDIQKAAIKAGDIQYQCSIRFKEAAFKAYDKKFHGKGIGLVVDKARLAFILADLNKVMKGGERFSADGKKKRTKLQLLNQFLAMKQKKVSDKLSSLTENDKANLDKSGRDLLRAWEMNDELGEFLGEDMVQFAKDVSQILRDLAPMIDEQSMKDVGMALSEMDEWYFPIVRDLGIFMQNANPYGGEPLTITQAVKDKLNGEMRGTPYLPTVPAFLTPRTLNLLYIDESADMFSVFHRRVFDVAQYVGFGDVKPVLTALLVGEKYQGVRDAIAQVRGKPALKALIEHGTQILNGYMEGANLYMLEKADQAAHYALVFSRTLALCGSLTSGLVQAIGSSAASATTIGWHQAGAAFWAGISNPKELSAEIIRLTQHAGYRARYGDPDAIVMSAASRAARSNIPIKLALSLLELEQIGYLPVSYGDRVPVLLMGASYCLMRKKELYEQGLSHEDAEKQATEETFHMIDETQQSHTTQGRDAWSRSEHEMAKFGIQFRTSVAQYAAKEVRAWEKFLAHPTVENFEAVLSISIHNHLVAPGLAAIARSLGFLIIASMDNKDRSLLDYMDVVHLKTSQLLLGSADALPFIGQVGATGLQKLIEAGSDKKKRGYYSGRVIDIPAFSVGTSFGKDLWNLYEHGGDKKSRERLLRNLTAYRQASAIWKFFNSDD